MAIANYFFDAANVPVAITTQGEIVPANTKRKITAAVVINTTGVAKTFTVYLVPSGGAAAVSNTVISARTIAPGESYTCPELVGRGLNAGGFLQTASDVAGLTFKYESFNITNG